MSEQNTGAAPAQAAALVQAPSGPIGKDSSAAGVSPVELNAKAKQIESDPNLSQAQKVEAKKQLKKLKIKYNGKELEEELPFEIPDTDEAKAYMTKHLQMSKMGQGKAQDFATLESEVRSFFQDLKNNPKAALANPNIGLDLKKLATDIIEEELENQKKSPEQLKAESLEKELKSIKEEREKEKEANKKREQERLQGEAFERYDMLMDQALEKNKDLPKSAYTVKKISDYMLLGLQNGLDVSPEDVIPLVREEMTSDLKAMFAVMPEDVIEALVGKDKISSIRKKSLAKAKAAQLPPKVQDTGGKPSENKDASKKVTIRDFFKV